MNEFNTEITKDILFPSEEILNQSPEKRFSETLRNKILYKQGYDLARFNPKLKEILNERMIYDDISEFIREHVKVVGKEQAVRDFHCGLKYLNKDFADLIKEDGDYGEKTFASLFEILQYYPLEVLKNAIRKGAKNNLAIEPNYNGGNTSEEEV